MSRSRLLLNRFRALSAAGLFLLACQASGEPAAVSELVTALDSRHSPDEVEDRLEEAMRRYEVPHTEEGYRSAVDVLREVRETTLEDRCDACDEMLILEHMLLLPDEGRLSFEEAARVAATIILQEQLFRERSMSPSGPI